MRDGGRATTPGGAGPTLKVPPKVRLLAYDYGKYDRGSIERLNKLVETGQFEVHLGGRFPLDQVVDAYRALESHYLGRLVVVPRTTPAR